MIEQPYRVLVTGSRDWLDGGAVWRELDAVWTRITPRLLIVVHGACKTGADAQAAAWVADMRRRLPSTEVNDEPHPVTRAEWSRHGGYAGPRRNAAMVRTGADVCLAFIRAGSSGATGCARLAEDAGIATIRWTA